MASDQLRSERDAATAALAASVANVEATRATLTAEHATTAAREGQVHRLTAQVVASESELATLRHDLEAQRTLTKEAVTKLSDVFRRPTPGAARAGSSAPANGTKELRQLRTANSELQQLVDNQQRQLTQLQDDIRTQDEQYAARLAKLEDDHRRVLDALKHELVTLNAKLRDRGVEVAQMQETLGAIEADAQTPVKLKRQLSAVRESHAAKGWLELPCRGNIKRFSWERRYAVLDPDALRLFSDQVAAGSGDAPLAVLPVAALRAVRPIRTGELYHARPEVTARVFVVTAVIAGEVARLFGASAGAAPSGGMARAANMSVRSVDSDASSASSAVVPSTSGSVAVPDGVVSFLG
jgi:hypothetical protein